MIGDKSIEGGVEVIVWSVTFAADCALDDSFKNLGRTQPQKREQFQSKEALDAFLADKNAWGGDHYYPCVTEHRHPASWHPNPMGFAARGAAVRTLVGLPA